MRWLFLLLLLLALSYGLWRTWWDAPLYPTWKHKFGNVAWNCCWFFLYGVGLLAFGVFLFCFQVQEWFSENSS